MSRSRMGYAAAKARALRHSCTKVRCEVVKVELEGSMRRIADLIGSIAAKGLTALLAAEYGVRRRVDPYLTQHRGFGGRELNKAPYLMACISDLYAIKASHELHHL